MGRGENRYVWQRADWPEWRYDVLALARPLVEASYEQGVLLGRLSDVGMTLRDGANLAALTDDVLRTSEIEGERFDLASVRSSIARRLGVDIGALAPVDRRVEGVVEMILDATGNPHAPLTESRLFGWHAALFPSGYSGMQPIRIGAWRDDSGGPMQVVSGPVHRHRVHYEAPPAERLQHELRRFFQWANGGTPEPPLLKAGIAHLWFVTLHPFDDGNGRIARAVGDLFLARADGSPQRFYSLSAQLQRERSAYYEMLERTQKGSLEITEWLSWFLGVLQRALRSAQSDVDGIMDKARFWQRHGSLPLNQRQVKVLNRLLDGFEGKLTSSKWAALTKCSSDTALRDIQALIELGVLRKSAAGGRSTAYELCG
jgi:Fic family protein